VQAGDALVVNTLVLEPCAEGVLGSAPWQVANPDSILAALAGRGRFCGCGLFFWLASRGSGFLFLLFFLCLTFRFFGLGLGQVDVDLDFVLGGDGGPFALFLDGRRAGAGGAIALAVGHFMCVVRKIVCV
jgi:hypothetical protein